MNIRKATDHDIGSILEVLKASLGEVSSKKTESVWRYKHIGNPFGRSLVLIAEEDSNIVGVRAFMRWQWHWQGKTYNSFRAVDTATHPDHQGKGIFKKLTLKALEIGKEEGNNFVFNTPNDQSKPGYLKMGWKEVSKLKIQLFPTGLIGYTAPKNEKYPKVISDGDQTPLFEKFSINKNKLTTLPNRDFLAWRYEKNPLQDYLVISNQNFYLAAYVKDHKKFTEFRVSELIYDVRNKAVLKEVKANVKKYSRLYNTNFISLSPKISLGRFIKISGGFGPVLTLKPLVLKDEEIESFLKINNWDYSLGDLELF